VGDPVVDLSRPSSTLTSPQKACAATPPRGAGALFVGCRGVLRALVEPALMV